MNATKRVLVVEDHDFICKAIAGQLSQDHAAIASLLDVESLLLDVVPATSLKEAESHLQKRDVDLIILDLDLSDGRTPIETLEELHRIVTAAKSEGSVALFTAEQFGREDRLAFLKEALMRFPLRGVIPKSTPAKRVHEGVARLLLGEEWYPSDLMKRLAVAQIDSRQASSRMGLTKREWDVAELIAEGLPNRKIAVRLNIGEQHVKQIVTTILDKLQLTNRTAVAVKVIKDRGVGPPDPQLVAT